MTVKEIVEKYLRDNGYDGLFNDNGSCACVLDDLMPCGYQDGECETGVQVESDDPDYDFCIVPKKEKP